MWSRVIRWIARAEIADVQRTAFVEGSDSGYQLCLKHRIADAYADGYNSAMSTVRVQVDAAKAELEFVRALFPLYRPTRDGSMLFVGKESRRVH